MPFPHDWYWLADEGRVFSSLRVEAVTDQDEGFVAFVASGEIPTRWPADDAGAQTDAALHEVLTPYGIGVLTAAQTTFSFLEFMELFTDAEQMTLVEASMTLPAVKLWYDKALGAEFIDLADARMEPGLSALVSQNLITEDRKAKVMKGEKP